ncbi:MAG TPA: type II toxin-antitoxin system RelE/ParE family toxin [Candidatus Diapherotrites archaeon]|uniref:Type II toxin-antitoxin system RelE/ParE family toxin n=1 Tax=Candidatus Iainarchaeum sp. TaxID=3101447 RepID=A0A7J4IUN0_9ARCH|nr:type II toxin-antitoxin system RelE/ParE family toxin [Candidatus Diapherotrites archaeon]
MWQIIFTHKARKDFLSLEKQSQQRIAKKLDGAKANPEKEFEALADCDYSKTRVGDYRIIAMLDFEKKEVTVHRIGHRKNIYDKL